MERNVTLPVTYHDNYVVMHDGLHPPDYPQPYSGK